MKRILDILLISLVVLTSCNEVALPIQVINIEKEAIVVPMFGAQYRINVESNTSWEIIAVTEAWVNLDFDNAVGNSVIELSVAPNEGAERRLEIQIQSIDGSVKKSIIITQMSGTGGEFLSIQSVRSLETHDAYLFPIGKIHGFVSSDKKNGNIPENTIYIQDSFSDKCCGIAIWCKNMPAFDQGTHVDLNIAGAELKRAEDGVLTLYPKSLPTRGECTSLTVTPIKLLYEDLLTGDYESMMGEISKFQVLDEYIGAEFSSNPILENRDGQQVMMLVKADALFSEAKYGQGTGSVSGVVGCITEGKPSIRPQSVTDVNFGHFRIGVLPGIKKLPYALSFYCASQKDEDPKYVNYTPVTWQPTTKMMTGVIVTDKDPDVGAMVEISAYASEISKTISGKGVSNFWAEAGANDNINASGFVSPDGKTVPAAECGWWITIPLQMNLPNKFNVFFGLAAGDWSINSWTLSYSYDKKDWTPAGDVKLNSQCVGGSYYYRFCVTVTPSVPFEIDNSIFLKLTPFGTDGCNPANSNADGHGSSCFVRLHSAVILQDANTQSTPVPEGAVLFEPFDNLTQGVDYFYGERNAGFANFTGAEFSSWTSVQKRGMSATGVYERPGYAQIGHVNDETTGSREEYTATIGSLTTAPLGKAGDFTLSFKAGAYRTPAIRPDAAQRAPDVIMPDITEAVLIINGGGTINGSSRVAISDLPYNYTSKYYSFPIKDATTATTLTFTSEPADGEFSRWFIDDILVK